MSATPGESAASEGVRGGPGWLRRSPCAAVVLLAVKGAALAQPADFMRDMPRASEVMSRFAGGTDPLQSLGRQCAALDLLERAFFRNHAIQTKDVSANAATLAVQRDYAEGFKQLRARYESAAAPMDDAKRQRWSRMCERGGQGVLDRPVTREEVWAALNPRVVAAYDQLSRSSDQRLAAAESSRRRAAEQAAQAETRDAERKRRADAERAQTRLVGYAVGAAILAVAVPLAVFGFRGVRRLNKYEFEHTTDGGVVQFESYEASLKHRRLRSLYSASGIAGMFGALAGGGTIVAMLLN